ncbi:MAG: hypothetical protein GEU79_05190 [Acidimicrobiia bacterium]|nr:hypothetical protein [Acidimicrobiia bacterium]
MRKATSRLAGATAGLLLLLMGCAGNADTPTTTANDDGTLVPLATKGVATTGATSPTEPAVTTLPTTHVSTTTMGMGDLVGWETTVIKVGDEELTVALADDARERSQGLRGVDDIGDLDGMLFVFENAREATFIMEDTIMPIDIGFYDSGGELVRTYQMVPCRQDDQECDVYPSEAAVAYALEVPAGTFSYPENARLTLP